MCQIMFRPHFDFPLLRWCDMLAADVAPNAKGSGTPYDLMSCLAFCLNVSTKLPETSLFTPCLWHLGRGSGICYCCSGFLPCGPGRSLAVYPALKAGVCSEWVLHSIVGLQSEETDVSKLQSTARILAGWQKSRLISFFISVLYCMWDTLWSNTMFRKLKTCEKMLLGMYSKSKNILGILVTVTVI